MLYERIKELCKIKRVSVSQLEKDLGFAKGSISKIDRHKPSADKIEKLSEYFGVQFNELTGSVYYEDEETREYALFLKVHPEYKVLFDASRRVKPEDIALVQALIERFNDGRYSGSDN